MEKLMKKKVWMVMAGDVDVRKHERERDPVERER
jgi:hypothetical protein